MFYTLCFMFPLLHLYYHIQHNVSMLIFNMVSKPPSRGHGFLSLLCLRAIFVFLDVSSLHSSSLGFHYYCQHFSVYSHATVRNHINTARSLHSSNHYHRTKLHSRDLLNLIKSQGFINLPS